MTISVLPVDINTDTWTDLISKLNDVIDTTNDNMVTVGGDPAVGNAAVHGQFYANVIIAVNFTTNTAAITSLTASMANVDTATINAASITQLNVNAATVNTATVATANVNTLVANTGNVRTLTSNTATITTLTANTGNVATFTSNNAAVTTLTVATANVTSNLHIAVDKLRVTGGNTTHKYMTTNGSGNLVFRYPILADISDFAAYQANVNSRLDELNNNALAFAIALG